MPKTKKAGSTGRWGPRYGRKIRGLVAAVERQQKSKHRCPSCLKQALKRVATGIWECRKCSQKFCGGAYTPQTASALMLKPVER